MDIEILELLVVLAQSLSTDVQNTIGTLGVEISHLAKRMKENRKYFSNMARSTKDRHKKNILSKMEIIVMKSLLKCMSGCYKQ